MTEYADREHFIPFRKADIIEMCAKDGKLNEQDSEKFRQFCEILAAYYHFTFHQRLEGLKNNFAPFNPDADTKPLVALTTQQVREKQENLIEAVGGVLEKANYQKLSDETLKQALTEESLITLKMHVDFDDFDQWVLYHRGEREETAQVKKMFKKTEIKMNIFERVMLLIKFKDEAYYKAKKKKLKNLGFTPGKMYVFLYKNIPKADLEVLFPNVQISMNFKDQMMMWVPAVLGGLATVVKILPQLILIAGVIYSLVFAAEKFDDNKMKSAIVGLTGLSILGGFVFKQYVAYKNKRIQFLKDITDTLFFKHLDCNAGVFSFLIDTAEEEECKAAILAYYHLLTHQGNLTEEQLDDTIENWFETKFNTKLDFEVGDAVGKLEKMQGKVVAEGQDEESTPLTALMKRDANGFCQVPSIDDAKTIIDYVWDNLYNYNAH